MKTIGIRAAPRAVTFVVYDEQQHKLLCVDEVKVPIALEVPDALKFIRSTILDVIREYDVEKAGVRISENTAHSFSVERTQIEGVIQEAFASSTVTAFYCGQIATIAARAGIPRTDFKDYVQGTKVYEPVENWAKHNQAEREAILTAIGAVNA